MDTKEFIRKHVALILKEETGDKDKPKNDSKPAPKPSGKRMGSSAQKGRASEVIKGISSKAVNNPGSVFAELGINKSTVSSGSNQEKAKKVILAALDNGSMSLAFEDDVTVAGTESEGWTVIAKVRSVEVEGDTRPIIPTGRAARYLGALMTAAKNLGVIEFDPENAQSMKHDPASKTDTGSYNIYVNLPI